MRNLFKRNKEPTAIDAKLAKRNAYSEFRKRTQYNDYAAFVKSKYNEQKLDKTSKI